MGLCSVRRFNKFENVWPGKTTLLKILAGKHMVGGKNVVQVLSRSAFHDTQLVCSGDLSYLGGSWSKTVGSAVSIPTVLSASISHAFLSVFDCLESN